MPFEIERKFLIKNDSWRNSISKEYLIKQSYYNFEDFIIRVRLHGKEAFIAIKKGISSVKRFEYEYSIPIEDAYSLLENVFNKNLIEKTRYEVIHRKRIWFIDEFSKKNKGLIIAETELKNENENIALPAWLGKEITGISRYFNSSLAVYPYQNWKNEEKS